MENEHLDDEKLERLPQGLLEELYGLLDRSRNLEPGLEGLPRELLERLLVLHDSLPEELNTKLLKLQESRPKNLPKGLHQLLESFSNLEQKELPEELLEILLNFRHEFQNLERERTGPKDTIDENPKRAIENTKESEKMIDEKLKGIPEEFTLPAQSLFKDDDTWQEKTFMSKVAKALIEHGNALLNKFNNHLKSGINQERTKDVETLFEEHVGLPQKVENLMEELQQEAFVEQISQDDQVWDEAMATAYNAFETGNVDHISQVQKAKANWMLAVRKYQSESRRAWRTFNVGFNKPSTERIKSSGHCNDVYQEVKHYKRSSEISEALLTYEQAKAQATTDLASAFGELVQQLFSSGAEAAVGEATLIQAEQSASETFWTSVQNALDNPST